MGGRRRNSEEDEAPFKNNEKGTRMVVGLSNQGPASGGRRHAELLFFTQRRMVQEREMKRMKRVKGEQ